MTETKPDLIQIAKNQRHMKLLEKMQGGKALTPGELRELQQYEHAGSDQMGVVDTREKVSKAFRVTVRTIDNWIKEGMPRTPDGNYDLAEIFAWKTTRDEGLDGSNKDKGKWEAYFRQFKALSAELEYRKQLGELVTKQEVEDGRIERILTVKRALLALPARLAPQVIGVDVQKAEEIIRKRITEIIQSFAGGGDGIITQEPK